MSLKDIRKYFGGVVQNLDPKFHEHTSPVTEDVKAGSLDKTFIVRVDSFDGVQQNPTNVTDNVQVTVKLFFALKKADLFKSNEAAWDFAHTMKLAAIFQRTVTESGSSFIKGVQFLSTSSETLGTNSEALAISMKFNVRAVFSLIDEEY